MTALSTKMSYPGTSSSYQSYYQPVHHNGFSNSHHLGSYPHHPRFAQQQQHSVQQKQPAAFPHSNNNMQTQGNQSTYGVSIPQRLISTGNHLGHKFSAIEQSQHGGNIKDSSQSTIKSEPIMHTDITPSQHDPPDLSQHRIMNNSASKAVNSYNQARPHGAFAHPHGAVSSQFPRTWIPARQPFVGNVPRAPANSALAQVSKAVSARQSFVGNVPRAPVSTAMTKPLQNNLLHQTEVSHQGISWVVTASEYNKYRDLFHKADTDKDGFVTGMEVRDMFIGTGLSQKYLIHIWDLVDTNQKGRLNCEQFALAMWLAMRTAVHKIEPPKELTSVMIPPSMRVKAPTSSNAMQYKKKENQPKPADDKYTNINKKIEIAPAIKKTNKAIPKATAKKAKGPSPPKDDLYGCPKCSLMYDDSQHSPRQLPCRHTFCIDCIDEALSEDILKCFTCGTSHTVLAAADFPVNVFITELLRRFLEEQSEEERKKYVHDSDACFYCENDEPPLKRIKVGSNKITCEIESSQENISSYGCEIGKIDGKLGDTHVNNKIRDMCNDSENNLNSIPVLEKDSQGKKNGIVSIGHPTSSIDATVSKEQNLNHNKYGNTDKTVEIRDTCNESENYLNSLSVLENYSQGKENSIVSPGLLATSINVSVSNEQNLNHNTVNMEENNNRNNLNENTVDNRLARVENISSNYEESSNTLNEMGEKHIDRLSCKEVFVENSTEVNINKENTLKPKETCLEPALSILRNNCNINSIQEREQVTEYQRLPRINDSKIDENMNSLSVDKFLEEIL